MLMFLLGALLALSGHSGFVDALYADAASEVAVSQGDVSKSKEETAVALPRSWRSPSWDRANRYAEPLVAAEGSIYGTASARPYLRSLTSKRGALAAAGTSAIALAVLLALWLRRTEFIQAAVRPPPGILEGQPAGDGALQRQPSVTAAETAQLRLRLEGMQALERDATRLVAYLQNVVTTAGLARLRSAVEKADREHEKVLAFSEREAKGEGEASAAREAMMRFERYADAVIYEAAVLYDNAASFVVETKKRAEATVMQIAEQKQMLKMMLECMQRPDGGSGAPHLLSVHLEAVEDLRMEATGEVVGLEEAFQQREFDWARMQARDSLVAESKATLREATEASMKVIVSRGHLQAITSQLRIWMQEAEEAARGCAIVTIAGGLVNAAEGRSSIEIDRLRLSALSEEVQAEHQAALLRFHLSAKKAEDYFKQVEKERSKCKCPATNSAKALEVAQNIMALCKGGRKELLLAADALVPLFSAGLFPSLSELADESAGELKAKLLPLAKAAAEGALSASTVSIGQRVAVKGKRTMSKSDVLRTKCEHEEEAAKARSAQATKSLQALKDATDPAGVGAAAEKTLRLALSSIVRAKQARRLEAERRTWTLLEKQALADFRSSHLGVDVKFAPSGEALALRGLSVETFSEGLSDLSQEEDLLSAFKIAANMRRKARELQTLIEEGKMRSTGAPLTTEPLNAAARQIRQAASGKKFDSGSQTD